MVPVLATPDLIPARAAQRAKSIAVARQRRLVTWLRSRRSSGRSSGGCSSILTSPPKVCPTPHNLAHLCFARGAGCRDLFEVDASMAAISAQLPAHVQFHVLNRPKRHCRTRPCAVSPNVTDCLCSDSVKPCQARCITGALSLFFNLVDGSRVFGGEDRTREAVARTFPRLSCPGRLSGAPDDAIVEDYGAVSRSAHDVEIRKALGRRCVVAEKGRSRGNKDYFVITS